MDFQIRQGNKDDAGFLARIMLLAGRSHLERGGWDILLDASERDSLEFLQRLALTDSRSFSHYSRFILAEIDGCPVSALCGYDPADAGISEFQQAAQEVADGLGWSDNEIEKFWQRFGPYVTCMFEEPAGTWVIENVATLPRFRQRGLMNSLLQRILEMGHERGYKAAQISMDIGNLPAQHSYEKAGFNVVDERRHADYEGVFGIPGRLLLTYNLAHYRK